MPVIEFRQTGKRYIVHHEHRFLAKELILGSLGRRTRGEAVWAVRHLDLSVDAGEAVGIVGANGAGKSTVLKLLTRVTAPTEGSVQTRGRIGPLLELGAGFDRELTGRENIFVNGLILGMNRRDLAKRFDQIVAFSELEEFLDVPLRTYSSGMVLRLGFAVATHIDAAILVIDEVLAVGDTHFQRKCLQKIAELRASGVTLVFVSHFPEHVRQLCRRCVWLDGGRLAFDGDVQEAVERYFLRKGPTPEQPKPENADSRPHRIETVRFLNSSGEPAQTFRTGQSLRVSIQYECRAKLPKPGFQFAIHGPAGHLLCSHLSSRDGLELEVLEGRGRIDLLIDYLTLVPGQYFASIALTDASGVQVYDSHDMRYPLVVTQGGVETQGWLAIPHRWVAEPEQAG